MNGQKVFTMANCVHEQRRLQAQQCNVTDGKLINIFVAKMNLSLGYRVSISQQNNSTGNNNFIKMSHIPIDSLSL